MKLVIAPNACLRFTTVGRPHVVTSSGNRKSIRRRMGPVSFPTIRETSILSQSFEVSSGS